MLTTAHLNDRDLTAELQLSFCLGLPETTRLGQILSNATEMHASQFFITHLIFKHTLSHFRNKMCHPELVIWW